MSIRRLSITLRALAPTVILSTLAAEAGLFAIRTWVPIETLRGSNDMIGNYLQTLGTVYAVLLAFVVFMVWTQFNDARGYVEKEAAEIMDLGRTACGLPDAVRRPVHEQCARYVKAVLEREWQAMSSNDERVIDELWVMVHELALTLHTFDPQTCGHQVLYAELLARFNDFSDSRTLRLVSSRNRIPLVLQVFLYMGAAATVGSMYLFAVDRAWVHALATGALTGTISHMLYVIHDLDDCFAGDWQVPRAPFERLCIFLAACHGKVPAI